LILFFFLWVVWLTSSRAARRNGCELRLLIASGILTGLVEPNAIFGNYFASVVFWAPIAFFLGSSGFRVRDPDKNG
ncbi:MAG: hypothetical protein Q8L05_03620, partial [Actinomycetota bacterium]|nr:hypothetical protein [Actinomycetota bacterium]